MHGDVETRRVAGGWQNVIQGTYATQEDAAANGRALAQYLRVEWFLRSRRGLWRLRNTYRHDPRESKG